MNRPVLTRDADCSFPCAGWATEACGGSQRLTVYETLNGNPPSTFPGISGFPSLGCYSDSVAKRALPVKVAYEGGLDVTKCATACSSQGYTLAGVEYGYGTSLSLQSQHAFMILIVTRVLLWQRTGPQLSPHRRRWQRKRLRLRLQRCPW